MKRNILIVKKDVAARDSKGVARASFFHSNRLESIYPPWSEKSCRVALYLSDLSLRLWPHALIGHSLGEYVAACLAGCFPLEDALALVAARGRLMQDLPGGSMLSGTLAEKELNLLVPATLSIAAVNGPSLCVISGPAEETDKAEATLTEKGIEVRRIHIDVAAIRDWSNRFSTSSRRSSQACV